MAQRLTPTSRRSPAAIRTAPVIRTKRFDPGARFRGVEVAQVPVEHVPRQQQQRGPTLDAEVGGVDDVHGSNLAGDRSTKYLCFDY